MNHKYLLFSLDFTTINWADVILTAVIIPVVYFIIKILLIDRPRINISFSKELYSKRPYPPGYVTLEWEYDIIIKNNSGAVARNISIVINESQNFLTYPNPTKLFPEFLHLEPYKEFATKGKTVLQLPEQEFLNIKLDLVGNTLIHEVGDVKYQNPQIELKPENLKLKSFYIIYSNQFGIKFYTHYFYNGNQQIQKNKFFKP